MLRYVVICTRKKKGCAAKLPAKILCTQAAGGSDAHLCTPYGYRLPLYFARYLPTYPSTRGYLTSSSVPSTALSMKNRIPWERALPVSVPAYPSCLTFACLLSVFNASTHPRAPYLYLPKVLTFVSSWVKTGGEVLTVWSTLFWEVRKGTWLAWFSRLPAPSAF